MSDWPSRRDGLRRGDDRLRVDAIVPVKLGKRASLAEMLNAERARAVALHGAEPRQSRGMAVKHGDQRAVRWHVGEQPLYVRAGMHKAALSRALGGGPAGVEPVGRRHR